MELLTGKCKEEFEKWFNVSGLLNLHILHYQNIHPYDRLEYFYKRPVSMAYGVYKQFFSENGIFTHIKDFQTSDNEIIHECNINGSACGFRYDNLDESIMQIVKIANKYFNDKNN